MVDKWEKENGWIHFNIKDIFGNMPKINFNIKLTKKQQEAYDIMHKRDCKFLIARWSRQC